MILQPQLKLRDPRLTCPTVDIAGAFGLFGGHAGSAGGATETEINDLVDTGALWAWDISHPDTLATSGHRRKGKSKSEREHRRELRILTKSIAMVLSLEDWRDALAEPSAVRCSKFDVECSMFTRFPATWDAVLSLMLPTHAKPFLTARECKWSLNIRRVHFINLVAAKALAGTDYRQGPGGSPTIDRASYIAFLRTRVIGGL